MINNNNALIGNGSPRKTAGRLSMISIVAISVGMGAAPVHAQDMTAQDMTASPAPVQTPPVVFSPPAPASPPMMEAPSASNLPPANADATPPVTSDRAADLAREGGFNAETVAPEALAQIEREQRERKAAAEKAAAAAVKAQVKTSSGVTTASASTGADAENLVNSVSSSPDAPDLAVANGELSPFPDREAAPAMAASSKTFPGDSMEAPSGETDWGLFAALAAMLGIGGAGAFAVSRRRKGNHPQAAASSSSNPLPASLNAAIMPELRREPLDVAPTQAQPSAPLSTVKADFAEFVANLPAFDAPLGKADRSTKLGQRRVAAAPRPYLGKADLSRSAGYFMANVDSMPTPQNPFLTRPNRLKRARFLDGKLASTSSPLRNGQARLSGKMQVSRPLEPAFS
ncbi:hypothetical protein [Parasphingorhabdus sp.]|uniref:hypothetical protein n=1 Tax=Parasphingorhabdus sp. TaxID=2709688 RepID=UPI003A8F835B